MAFLGTASVHAWACFNGGSGGIRDSYNNSSISRYGTGKYQINIDTDCNNDDYCILTNKRYNNSGSNSTDNIISGVVNAVPTSGICKIFTRSASSSVIDCDDVSVAIIGDRS